MRAVVFLVLAVLAGLGAAGYYVVKKKAFFDFGVGAFIVVTLICSVLLLVHARRLE